MCVRDVMKVVFSVCIVTCGAVGSRVWEVECFAMHMLYVCVLCASCGSSQCCMTCRLLMLVEDERGGHNEEAYSRAGLITAL